MNRHEDRDQIRQLIATYTNAGDQRRNDLRADIFAEDAAMVIPTWRAEGQAGILKALAGGGAGQPTPAPAAGAPQRLMRHHLTTCTITFDGPDEASGRTYWINFSEKGMDHAGLYADRFRRLGGHWKIVFREVRIDWKASDSWLGPQMTTGPAAGAPPTPLIVGD
jgi:ketosteroid isomerase-like protein